MRTLKFDKYHSLGNDFLIIDLTRGRIPKFDFNRLSLEICDRQFGVGADGILILTRSRLADCMMDVFNSDGSWAEKSGNGLRCAAAYIYGSYSKRKNIKIETVDGIATARIIKPGKKTSMIQVSVGQPVFETKRIPMKSRHKFHINEPLKVGGLSVPATVLAVGNPHCVIFVDNFNFDWLTLGEHIEYHKSFPNRTNVEFVKIVSRKKVILNDWERGAGATGSSGTGASAAVAAGVIGGHLNRRVEVVFPSGSLEINWNENDNTIYLTGPAEFVCRGEYMYDSR